MQDPECAEAPGAIRVLRGVGGKRGRCWIGFCRFGGGLRTVSFE